MGLLSILPVQFQSIETLLTRFFLLMGVLLIGPWACLLVYDLILYLFRSISHEIPIVGGRAKGKARPRAPSLTERPSGHRRKFSIAPRRKRNHHDRKSNLDPHWHSVGSESELGN